MYLDEHGVDVLDLEGAGAAGGLGRRAGRGRRPAGERASTWWPTRCELDERLEGADLVITGEGFLDAQSFEGKVVGGVVGLAARARRAGAWRSPGRCSTAPATASRPSASSTASARSGRGPTRSACIEEVAADVLAGHEA